MSEMDADRILARLKAIQRAMRDAILADMRTRDVAQRAAVAQDETSGDTLYVLDQGVEGVLLEACRAWGGEESLVLIAEGLTEGGNLVFPEGATEEEASLRVIFDPLDGTRGLMYDKRSAWILAGVAPNLGPATCLADIVLAVQTEVPTSKQYLADVLWAIKGRGAHGERQNLLTGESRPLPLQPSRATGIAHGFAMLSKFFPGRKPIVAAIEEALIRQVEGADRPGKVRVFDDQYICTGGQLYELIVGHDRFNGDLRAHLMRARGLEGDPPAIAVHPYDLCTELIAREAGVIVTDLDGGPLRAPLAVDADVSWLGYANPTLRARLEPVLQRLFRVYGLL
ncbi:MAG: inositol monophosphatase [Anaerolineae bacterium]